MKKVILYIVLLSAILKINIYTEPSLNEIKNLHRQGMRFYKQKKFKKALKIFKKILEIDPVNQDALYNCACMNALIKKYEKTIRYLHRLFRINPKWKVKLQIGVEKDFKKFYKSKFYKIMKKYWLAKSNFHFLKTIQGIWQNKRHGTKYKIYKNFFEINRYRQNKITKYKIIKIVKMENKIVNALSKVLALYFFDVKHISGNGKKYKISLCYIILFKNSKMFRFGTVMHNFDFDIGTKLSGIFKKI